MMVLLGDVVTVSRQVAGDEVFITGRINGIVQKDNGDLKYFYVKGIDSPLYLSDGWSFDEEIEFEIEEEQE